MRKKTALVQH